MARRLDKVWLSQRALSPRYFHSSSYIMVLKVHLSLRVFSTNSRWVGTLRGPPSLMNLTRPISVSAVNMGRERSRLARYCQRPVVIIREVERKSGLPIGKIILGASFLVVGELA